MQGKEAHKKTSVGGIQTGATASAHHHHYNHPHDAWASNIFLVSTLLPGAVVPDGKEGEERLTVTARSAIRKKIHLLGK